MNVSKWTRVIMSAGLVALTIAAPADAENVEKKLRLAFNLGGYNPQDEIPSDAANQLLLFERDFELEQVYIDPRDDSAVFGTLEVRPGTLASFSAQYAVTGILIFEASLGYTKTDLGKAEVQAQFDQIPIDEDFGFNFKTYRVDVGEVEIIPLQISALARFRPRAAFNPYMGGGLGYSFLGFEPSAAFNELSLNLDASQGQQSILGGAINGNPALVTPPGSPIDLQAASVDTDDTFTWHVLLGAEYTFKPRWALLMDFRYNWSSREIRIGFNGQEDLGISVPFLTDFIDSPVASESFGAMAIAIGGLIDGGSLVPSLGQPASTNCAMTPQLCTFDTSRKDGLVDPGFYYINGGSVDLDAFTFTAGVRYTFK